MRRAAARPDTRFVLSTREYILRQAHRVSDLLEREESDVHRFLLRLEDYTRQERARILYNHVFFSPQVDATARQALLRNRTYLRIVDHQNYNPRLIEWMTGLAGHASLRRNSVSSASTASMSCTTRARFGRRRSGTFEGPEQHSSSRWPH
jgi:hypothetical protein